MLEGVRALCREEGLLPPAGGTVLAAVSGGEDSMCLLSLLLEEGKAQGFSVEAAHFDHHIRPSSGEDAAFVRRWCGEQGVPCHVGGADIPALAARERAGLEDTARRYRYAFLRETAERVGAERIATAHNADDNGETLLLHLLRGSGLGGLGGIAPRQGMLVRPLLTTSRREIEEYNRLRRIPHVEDETNADCGYTRNFLRHQVLPLLRERNPSLTGTLNRTAFALRRDHEYLEGQAAELTRGAVDFEGGLALPAALLWEAHPALGSRALQQLVSRVDSEVVLSAAQREQGLALCAPGRSSGWVSLPRGLELRRVYDRLAAAPAMEGFLPLPLRCPGVTETPGWRFTAEEAVCPEGKFNRQECFYLKPGEYLLRPRRTGDEITLPARPRKSLKKLLIDSRFPRRRRDGLPVLECGGAVAAVTGFGADCAFLPRPGERAIRVTAEEKTPPVGGETR